MTNIERAINLPDFHQTVGLEIVNYGADWVALDAESTILDYEMWDSLAKQRGVLDEVSAVTRQAMSSGNGFSQAIMTRMGIVNPTFQMLTRERETLGNKVRSDATAYIRGMQLLGKKVIIVSGGFIEVVGGLENILGTKVYANQFLVDSNRRFIGIKNDGVLCHDEGKRILLDQLMKQGELQGKGVVVGDGASDRKAISEDIFFIGFGGVVEREQVRKEAGVFVRSFAPAFVLTCGQANWSKIISGKDSRLRQYFIQGALMIINGEVDFRNIQHELSVRDRLIHFIKKI